MTKHRAQTDDATARAARRLLQALNEPGARGARSDVDERMIVVAAPRNGVTIVRASVQRSAADHAIAAGLAKWEGEGKSRRLLLTEEGRAHLRRLAAPKQADVFLVQHSRLELRALEKGAPPALCNEGESPLAWLARRKDRDGRPFLAPAHVEAGERFRRDITQAQILQRVTADWEAAIASARRSGRAGGHVTDVAIDARRRLGAAFEAVGPDLAGLLTDVCGYLKGLELVESERGWPQRSAKVVLRIALERLALHYGLASEARGRSHSPGLLHWGAEDYRPEISAG
ncbi:MAG: ATPase [Methylocystaceae bacterium]|nr:MAG: ATPase [Methylocystaceae bacterium]